MDDRHPVEIQTLRAPPWIGWCGQEVAGRVGWRIAGPLEEGRSGGQWLPDPPVLGPH